MPTASAIPPQIQQEFAVTLGALDGRWHLAGLKVSELAGKIADRVENLLVLRRIPNHSTLPHRPFTNFELRFDQGDDVARRAQKIPDPREHQAQGDEGNVDDGEVRRCGELVEVADIDPLQDDHAGVLAKSPGQLSVADVDRDHALRATLQENVCKAAGRRTHIEAVTAARIDGE